MMSLSNVLLPAPLCPTIPSRSPRLDAQGGQSRRAQEDAGSSGRNTARPKPKASMTFSTGRRYKRYAFPAPMS